MYIYGRNPVKEAYRAGKTVDKLFMQKGEFDPMLSQVHKLAKEARTVISYVDKNMLDKLSGGGNHQGVVAAVTDFEYCDVQDILHFSAAPGDTERFLRIYYKFGALISKEAAQAACARSGT